MTQAAGRPQEGDRAVNLAVAAATFALVLPAELPDKTALASLVLGARHRPLYVFAGAAAGFAVHVALAVTAGGLLALLPHRVTEAVVAVAFLAGAVLLLTASLAARYHDPISVAVGSVLALWTVAALAITGGRTLLRLVPMKVVIGAAAIAMAALAVLSLISAIRG